MAARSDAITLGPTKPSPRRPPGWRCCGATTTLCAPRVALDESGSGPRGPRYATGGEGEWREDGGAGSGGDGRADAGSRSRGRWAVRRRGEDHWHLLPAVVPAIASAQAGERGLFAARPGRRAWRVSGPASSAAPTTPIRGRFREPVRVQRQLPQARRDDPARLPTPARAAEVALALPANYPTGRLLRYLGRDRCGVSERVDGRTYSAAIRLDGRAAPVVARVAFAPGVARCRVEGAGAPGLVATGQLHDQLPRARAGDRPCALRGAARGNGGARAADRGSFDALVRVIVGQQLAHTHAATLRGRLYARIGTRRATARARPRRPRRWPRWGRANSPRSASQARRAIISSGPRSSASRPRGSSAPSWPRPASAPGRRATCSCATTASPTACRWGMPASPPTSSDSSRGGHPLTGARRWR